MNKLDVLATRPNYFDHVAPVWDALPDAVRGTFYVPIELESYAIRHLKHQLYLFSYDRGTNDPPFDNPTLVASYGDMVYVHRTAPSTKIIMMEHGIGHTFGTAAYPNGIGKRDFVSLFLPPNDYTMGKIRSVRDTLCHVVGTPKMDRIINELNPSKGLASIAPNSPTIAIGFHWGSSRNQPPESGSAWEHYRKELAPLSKKYRLIGYGHPLADDVYEPFFKGIGVPYEKDFYEIMKKADICINDLSSAVYEFLCTGKPVILLNAPWFRKEVHHGLRFWDYSDIGPSVDGPEFLVPTIERVVTHYGTICADERLGTLHDLYPYLGESAKRASDVVVRYLLEDK